MDEGQFGQLSCTVLQGDPPFSFSWTLQGAKVSAEAGLTTSQIGSRLSLLMIERVGHRHIGSYSCKVSNQAGEAAASTELNVNG